jgi:hypothetical protein
MPAVQIVLNQTGASAGIAGQAREDLVTGVPVIASISGGPFLQYLWTLNDRAVDFNAATISACAPLTPTMASTTFTPIDVAGTYLVQLLVDSGQGLGATPDDVATITFYAGPTLATAGSQLPLRVPAYGERTEHNVPDPINPGSGLNTRGWAQTMGRWFTTLVAAFFGSQKTWARVQLTSSGAMLISNKNVASVTRTALGVVSITFTVPQNSSSYGVQATPRSLGASQIVGAGVVATAGSAVPASETTSGLVISRFDVDGNPLDADFTFGVLST